MCEIILISHKPTRLLPFCQEKFCEKAFEKSDTNETPSLVPKRPLVCEIVLSFRAIMQIVIERDNLFTHFYPAVGL
jgi:hypothetical protein